MRHRARPKLLGLVRLPDRPRPRSTQGPSRPSPSSRLSLPSPRHPTRVAAAVAGGLVLAGGGGYALTALVDEPEAPYAVTGPTPERTDDLPVSRGTNRPALSDPSSPSAEPSATSSSDPRRTSAGADSSRTASDDSSGSQSASAPAPATGQGRTEGPVDRTRPDEAAGGDGASQRRGGSEQGDGERTEAGTSSHQEERTGSTASSSPSSEQRHSPSPTGDEDPPQTTIEGTLGAAYPSFVLRSDEPGSTFTCSVDDAPYRPCSSSIDLSDLGMGEHSLEVVATDRHGNSDPTPAVTTWVVREANGLGG